jgi:hypothetical protein
MFAAVVPAEDAQETGHEEEAPGAAEGAHDDECTPRHVHSGDGAHGSGSREGEFLPEGVRSPTPVPARIVQAERRLDPEHVIEALGQDCFA